MTRGLQWRGALVLAAGAVALLGASGITEAHLFHQASTLKYVLTVIGPLFVGVLAMTTSPLVVVTGILVIAAPFAGFSMTFSGVHVPLLAPILILAVVIAAFSETSGRLPRSALAAAGGLLLVGLLLPVIDSPVRTDVIAVLISLFGAAFLASRVSSDRRGFTALAWTFVGMAAIQAALAIWEHSTGHRLNLYGSAGSQTLSASTGYFFGYGSTSRPPGSFYDPISLGNILAIALVLGLGLAVHYGQLRRWRATGAAVAAIVIIGIALELTLSRMSWVGASAGVVVAVLMLPRGPRRTLLPAVVLAVAIPVALGAFSGSSNTLARLSSITHPLNEAGTGQGDVVRVEIWHRALSVAEHHPVAGVGLGRFQRMLASDFPPAGTQGQAQSTYLQLAAEGGALALIGLLAILWALKRDLAEVIRSDRVWGAVLTGACIAMFVTWLTDVTIRYSGVAVLLGVLFGMVAGRARDARRVAEAR